MIDVDLTYDPSSGLTLDEHREIELAKIEQPGFGVPTVHPEPQPEPVEKPTPEEPADPTDE